VYIINLLDCTQGCVYNIILTKIINDMNGKSYEDRLRCLRLWTLEEKKIGKILLKFSKRLEGLVIFHFISFLSCIQIAKVLGVIHANSLHQCIQV